VSHCECTHVFQNNLVCKLNRKAFGLLNSVSKQLEVGLTDQEGESVGMRLYPGSRTFEKLRVAWRGRSVREFSCVDQF
jgi:hypothetical protein